MKEELLIMKGGYMSRKLFNASVDHELHYKIQTKYPLPEWEWARSQNDYRHTISTSAIELSERIKKELDVDVFPLIITRAIKGYAVDGQCKFEMFGKEQYSSYLFDYPAAYYKRKSYKLILDQQRVSEWLITLDKI